MSTEDIKGPTVVILTTGMTPIDDRRMAKPPAPQVKVNNISRAAAALLIRVRHYVDKYVEIQRGSAEAERFFPQTQILTHFTRMEVLREILKSEDLWMGHVAYQNDAQEQVKGLGALALATVQGRRPTTSQIGPDLQNDDLVAAAITSLTSDGRWPRGISRAARRLRNELVKKSPVDAHVCCFSAVGVEADILSMWRGYGGNGNGAALMFYGEDLAQRARERPGVFLVPTIYDSDVASSLMEFICVAYCELLDPWRRRDSFFDPHGAFCMTSRANSV